MAHSKCLVCEYITGDINTHAPNDLHEPIWEHCSCGSGGHPNPCELHPWAYGIHCLELNAENDVETISKLEDRVKELEQLVKELLSIRTL